MASRADIEAGKAFVALYLHSSQFRTGLSGSKRELLEFAASVASALSPARWIRAMGEGLASLGQKLTIAGGAAAFSFVPAIKAAGTVMETANKFAAVFGSQAQATAIWIDALGERVGRSRVGIQDSISAYQAFFVGMGIGRDQANQLSRTMAELAIDMSSFFNISGGEANERMLSALAGSVQVLDMFGINARQAALEAELAAMGINKAWADVTEPEKALARVRVIQKAMTAQGAIGDAERTSGSLANSWRRVTDQLNDLAAAIGNALIPVVTPLVKWVGDLAEALTDWARRNPEVIANLGRMVIDLTAFGATLFLAGKALAAFGTAMGVLWTLGKVVVILGFIGPAILKVVAFFHLWSLAAGGLSMVFSALFTKLLVFGGPIVLLAAGVLALGAAWVNAKIQGISFGQSVLDLTNRLTGMENAYSRLRDAQDQQKRGTIAIGDTEEALKGRDVAGADAGLTRLEAQLKAARDRLAEIQNQTTTVVTNTGQVFNYKTADPDELRAAQLEVTRLENNLKRLRTERDQMALGNAITNAANQAAAGAKKYTTAAAAAGRDVAGAFWGAFKETATRTWDATAEFQEALKRARAEGIADPQQRERALINLDYDQQVRAARSQGKPTSLLEQARQQDLQNVDDRFAREAADRRKQLEQQTADDIARLRIETTQKGQAKELALLKLRQQREREEAQRAGADLGKLGKKHDLEQMLARNQMPKNPESASIAGTFSGYAAAFMAGPQTAAAATAANTADMKKTLKESHKTNQQMLDLWRDFSIAFT
jgi:hypothetical protein